MRIVKLRFHASGLLLTLLTAAIVAIVAVAPGSAQVTRDASGANPPSGRSWTTYEFTGSGQPKPWIWNEYWGSSSPNGSGCWDSSHLVESGGVLNIKGSLPTGSETAPCATGSQFVTAGLKLQPSSYAQTYGTFLVRFRMDQGQGVSLVVLLWPANNSWPPEVDFAEDNGASPRRINTATLHYGSNNTMVSKSVSVDMTTWHTIGVRWSDGRLAYILDGQIWATVTSSSVPSIPMVPAIQTQAWNCGVSTWEQCRNAFSPNIETMQIAWVATNPSATAPL
jgi:beta-glucanase (GH16 family)